MSLDTISELIAKKSVENKTLNNQKSDIIILNLVEIFKSTISTALDLFGEANHTHIYSLQPATTTNQTEQRNI